MYVHFRRFAVLMACSLAPVLAQRATVILDQFVAQGLKDKYVALTDSWAQGIRFTDTEQRAMESGRQREDLMIHGLDDPLAKKVLAAGEPSFDAMAALYPGKILDRTVLGSYSDPAVPSNGYDDEFAIYWNGAIGANLLKGKLANGNVQPLGHNTVLLFRVGPGAEIFGKDRNAFSSLGYQGGYLPIVVAEYRNNGVRYRQTAFAERTANQSKGWDIAYVEFAMTNVSEKPAVAVLSTDLMLMNGQRASFEGGRLLDTSGAVLASVTQAGAQFDGTAGRLTYHFSLKAGETARVHFKVPYVPDAGKLLTDAGSKDFDAAHARVSSFWNGLIAKAPKLNVPEQRVNDVWRALLLQNFVLADGPKFTYGSGLKYNDSTYPQENGFGTHTFAMYGFPEYADQLQPWFVGMSVTPEGAGRKYQNRRAMVLHHLFENWRLTGRSDLFDRFKQDYYRIAEEIISERHSTMKDVNGARPLHWGLLPPDKPGVDVQASTQTVYVLGHNITNCQGLQDFGEFLTHTGIDSARGNKYIAEASDFRKTLMSAMERAAIRVPGRAPFVDLQTLYFKTTPDYGPEPYDDLALGRLQGTYYHYWVDMSLHYNFFNPDDQVGRWLADYVEQRNGFVLGCTRARQQNNKPYWWINNVYDGGYYNYRLRSGQIEDFLLGFYSKLAFGMSRYLYVASEGSPFIGYNTHDGGYVGADYSFPNSAANADTLLMFRNMLALEELKDDVETGTLYLMRAAPRAWFEQGKRIEVSELPTYFGNVSFSVDSKVSQGKITATIGAPTKRYRDLVVSFRHPTKSAIRSVKVNGKEHSDFDPAAGSIRIPAGARQYTVEASY